MTKTILILDSSQIQAFLECPTLWYYGYKKRLIPNNARINTPMDMGTYGHKLLEIIYKERARGTDYQKAIDLAFAYDVDKTTCRCSHGIEHHGPSCNAIGCNCESFTGIEFPLSAIDRSFVRERVLDYTFVEGNGIPELIPTSPEHVEVGFSHKLYEDEDRLYILEGRIDLMGQIANNCPNGWADHKFQARERDLYLKSIQFRNYSLVTQLSIGVVNYIRFAKKIEKDKTFKRAIISFSRQEIDAWHDNLIKIYNKVENAINPIFPDSIPEVDWQWYTESDLLRNRASCSGKFGYPCDYTSLCENFANPQLIKIDEKTNFQQKPAWRPW